MAWLTRTMSATGVSLEASRKASPGLKEDYRQSVSLQQASRTRLMNWSAGHAFRNLAPVLETQARRK